MQSLADRIAKANTLLMPYAVPHGGQLGRTLAEPDDATRFPFQRDRDRIIHTQAFRRLKQKTQVFVSGQGDHYRTRITHTLEVAQISRDIARTLGLNEDLAEAIALAHDLGHTPFGHAGEEAMRDCMKPFGKTFEHNEQSLRIVRVLESRTDMYPGLNLSLEVLEGLMKHRSPTSNVLRAPSLEAQVVNLADEIAYMSHDADDGLRAELFDADALATTKLGSLAFARAREHGTESRGFLVNVLVTDVYEETELQIASQNIVLLKDVYRAQKPIVQFSSVMRSHLDELKDFLWKNMYLSDQVQEQAKRGRNIIQALFAAYLKRPPEKVLLLQQATSAPLEDAVKDYIAGMTDPFAIEAYAKL